MTKDSAAAQATALPSWLSSLPKSKRLLMDDGLLSKLRDGERASKQAKRDGDQTTMLLTDGATSASSGTKMGTDDCPKVAKARKSSKQRHKAKQKARAAEEKRRAERKWRKMSGL